ncbi:hypothetical protein ACHAWF_010323 [Thalassiosira exigua]
MSEEEADCPLCLCPLEPFDEAHPLQCPSQHCHFNCCTDCLGQMIKSAKDDHVEASDGNTFRVFLHCPNCRSNLGPSIRDTLLLRKVDKYSREAFHGCGLDVIDETLSASELRFKHALEDDEYISSSIEGAKRREDEFFRRGHDAREGREDREEKKSSGYLDGHDDSFNGSFGRLGGGLGRQGSVWSFDDEEGVEADLLTGPHNSFIYRHHSQLPSTMAKTVEAVQAEDVEADKTLLFGLDAFMTEEEQQFVTRQMISGDPAKLAAATEMMHYVSALSRQGMKPSMKRQNSRLNQLGSKRHMLESIKEVIREGNEARKLEEEKEARQVAGAVASRLTAAARGVANVRRNQHRLVDMEVKRQMDYMKIHPLPLRMPKYAEITVSRATTLGLDFMDDVWDGTVLDAFSKITVNKNLIGAVKISKQHAQSAGVTLVIDADPARPSKSCGKGYIDTSRPRVIVSNINREMGRQGVVTGDVLTHFNGEKFRGSAEEFTAFVRGRSEREVLTFVFNADDAVAEALRRRSMISES